MACLFRLAKTRRGLSDGESHFLDSDFRTLWPLMLGRVSTECQRGSDELPVCEWPAVYHRRNLVGPGCSPGCRPSGTSPLELGVGVGDLAMSIAYLANRFPEPLESYVGEEIHILRKLGGQAVPCSVKQPN